MSKQNKAFTLVELIVVITILAILGTIAFISFQGYSRDSRDSVRISDMNNIEKAMELMLLKGSKLPKPENNINIYASGTLIGYQGEVGLDSLNKLGVNNGGFDPLDDSPYTYVTTKDLNKYQILGFLEQDTTSSNLNILDNSYAKDYSSRFPVVKGNNLGVLLNSGTLEPVNNDIDVILTNTIYVSYISNEKNIIGTGGLLFEILVNSSCKRIKTITGTNKDGFYDINIDGTGEVSLYCDMNTNGGGRTRTHILEHNTIPNNITEYNKIFTNNNIISKNLYTSNILKLNYNEFIYITDDDSNKVKILDEENIKMVGNKGEGFSEWVTAYSDWANKNNRSDNFYYYISINKRDRYSLINEGSGYWNDNDARLSNGRLSSSITSWYGSNFPFSKRAYHNNWCYSGFNSCTTGGGSEWASLWLR